MTAVAQGLQVARVVCASTLFVDDVIYLITRNQLTFASMGYAQVIVALQNILSYLVPFAAVPSRVPIACRGSLTP